jgi:hypothetical protein
VPRVALRSAATIIAMSDNPASPNRDCGECHACCRHMRIDSWEMTKLPGDLCAHYKQDSRCTIYGDRPGPCREFLCGWRLLPLEPEWRPDRCEILIVPVPGDAVAGAPDGCKFLFFGRLDAVFWRPFVNFVSTLAAKSVPVFVSVPGPRGYHAAMMALHTIPEFRQAAAARNVTAAVTIMASAIQSCVDAPKDPLTFDNPCTD